MSREDSLNIPSILSDMTNEDETSINKDQTVYYNGDNPIDFPIIDEYQSLDGVPKKRSRRKEEKGLKRMKNLPVICLYDVMRRYFLKVSIQRYFQGTQEICLLLVNAKIGDLLDKYNYPWKENERFYASIILYGLEQYKSAMGPVEEHIKIVMKNLDATISYIKAQQQTVNFDSLIFSSLMDV
jgi:hypothetical protein